MFVSGTERYDVRDMELRSVLLSQDEEVIELMGDALEDLGFSVEVHPTPPWAGEDVCNHHIDAVIVDFDVQGAEEFLRGVRSAPGNRQLLTFAVVNRDIGLPTAFAMGATLALLKPLTLESARSNLRAAYGLIIQERRRFFRYPIETLVTISPDEHTSIIATSVNISEGGMALKSDRELQSNGLVQVTFSLPGIEEKFGAQAVVLWRDTLNHAGLRFEELSRELRERLSDWLTAQASER